MDTASLKNRAFLRLGYCQIHLGGKISQNKEIDPVWRENVGQGHNDACIQIKEQSPPSLATVSNKILVYPPSVIVTQKFTTLFGEGTAQFIP